MQRTILGKLLNWKDRETRKPLLIDCARQTGKTYLLETLFGSMFQHTLRIDLLESPDLAVAFEGSLAPEDIISKLQPHTANCLIS